MNAIWLCWHEQRYLIVSLPQLNILLKSKQDVSKGQPAPTCSLTRVLQNILLGLGDDVSHFQAINLSLDRTVVVTTWSCSMVRADFTGDFSLARAKQASLLTHEILPADTAPPSFLGSSACSRSAGSEENKTKIPCWQDQSHSSGLSPVPRIASRDQRAVLYLELEEQYSPALQEALRSPAALSGFFQRYSGACSYLGQTVSYMLSCVLLGDLEHLSGV